MNKQNDLFICKGFVDWKKVFYMLLDGKYDLENFEKEIYKLSHLENILGKDLYIDLLSYNYKDESQLSKINQLIYKAKFY